MNSNSSPELTQSVEDFIELGISDEMTYSNFAVLAKCLGDTNVVYAQDNVIYDYISELKKSCIQVVLSDEELIRYRYNPKRLSFDVYGSTELYFIILAVNGMCSFKDFNKKSLKLLYKKDMNDLLTKIYNAEMEYLNRNRTHLEEDKK